MGSPKSTNTSKTSPAKIGASEKARQALDLRQSGLTYAQIADRLGYSDESGARKATEKLLARVEFEAVSDYRKLMLMRLEEIYSIVNSALWDRKEQRPNLWAVDRAQALLDQQARLLGLYDAVKMEISHSVDWRNELSQAGVDAGAVFEQLVQSIANQSSGDAENDQ